MVKVCSAEVEPTSVEGIDGVDGEKVGAVARPVAVKATLCGLPEALSVNTRFAVLKPAADGEKVNVTVQVALGARVCDEQLSATMLKRLGLVPLFVTAPDP